nr:serine/threonine protein kinase [Bacteroidales bacterium]
MDNTIKAKKLIKEIKTAKKGGEISPHKYILLFSISEVFDIHREHENNFTYSELEQIYLSNFNDYFDHFPDYRKVMEHPFYYLQNDGFWYLKIKKGKEQTYRSYQQKRLTRKRLLETVDYAYLDSEIYKLLQNPTARQAFQEELKNFIIGLSNEQRESNNGHKYVHETASLYEHEQVAISLINDSVQADDIGKLISNVLLHDSQSNNYFEIDILLATSFGLLVIELKHWSGHIRVNPYNWVVNEINYRSDPHKVNNFKAKIVKGIYQHHFKTFPEIWVESVVVLTNPDGIVEGANSPKIAAEQELKNPTLASIDDLVTYLKRKKENPRKQILSRQQVDAIIEYFSALNQPKQSIKYSVPGYETLEYISQKPECIEMVARPIHGRGKGLY